VQSNVQPELLHHTNETTQEHRAETIQLEATMDFSDGTSSDAEAQTHTPDSAKDSVPNPAFFTTEKSAETQHFESWTEERVRQVKEAQMISQQIVKSVHFRQGITNSEFSLTLEPDYLGQLRMKISSNNDTVSAHIVTDTPYTKNILLENISMLKESLNNAGVKLDQIEITVEESDAGLDFDTQNSGNGLEARTSSNKSSTDDFEFPSYTDLVNEFNELKDAHTYPLMPGMQVDENIYSVNFLA
jgi:flagellar hook-length control protein FliK